MELPAPLRAALDEAVAAQEYARLGRAAARIRERYLADAADGTPLVRDDAEALAYAVTRMPATYGACAHALKWLLPGLGEGPRTLLDVGAGTGAAAWAAAELMELEEITCLEREGAMRRLGEGLMRQAAGPVRDARWRSADIRAMDPGERADLVIAGYVLGEMSGADRGRAALALWRAARQALVIVEPGTPAGYRRILEIRRTLREAGANIAAPCPAVGECPLPEGDWCHFTCRVARSRLHRQMKAGDAPYEDEKFAYIAATRKKGTPVEARVLRHPIIRPGNIELSLCTAQGLARVTVTKRDAAGFRRARKAAAGDAFA